MCGKISITALSLSLSCTQDDEFSTDDGFFDMISKFQSKRMEDQRTPLPHSLVESKLNGTYGNEEEDLVEALWRMQSSRIEDQRCDMPSEPPHIMAARGDQEGDCLTNDELFELIFRCQVSPPKPLNSFLFVKYL